MGNQMCKERSDVNSKSPIDRVLRCGNVMCPTPFNKKPRQKYWRKQVLETKPRPPGRPSSKPVISNIEDGWRDATLSVPLSNKTQSQTIYTTDTVDSPTPVPPPRKKRASTLLRDAKIKNGFKDVFASDSRRHSFGDAATKDSQEIDQKIRYKSEFSIESMRSEDFADFSKEIQAAADETPQRRVSKVGNKKSDKFLGENLSDSLSDETYTYQTSSDDADTVIKVGKCSSSDSLDDNIKSTSSFKKLPTYEKETLKKTESTFESQVHVEPVATSKIASSNMEENEQKLAANQSNSLDKKAEFLMTMLSNYHDDEHKYKGMQPVEEPLIVPKRKIRRHICDDPEHFLKHEQKEEERKEASDHEDHSGILENTGPRKPDRDLIKYRQSLDSVDMKESFKPELLVIPPSSILRPTRQKRLSRENLPSPPERPKRQNEDFAFSSSRMVTSTPKLKMNSEANDANTIINDSLETNQTIQRIISMPAIKQTKHQTVQVEATEKVEALLKKCKSSNSFLTQELMSELMKSRYGFDHWPEDYGSFHHDDGSKNVAPTSKLKIRKISSSQRIQQDTNSYSPSIAEEEQSGELADDRRMKFTIGSQEVVVAPKSPTRHISFSDQLTPIPDTPAGEKQKQDISRIEKTKPGAMQFESAFTDAGLRSPMLVPQLTLNLSEVKTSNRERRNDYSSPNHNPFFDAELLENLVRNESPDIRNVIKDILDNKESIVKEFQNYLEDELNSPKVLEKIKIQQQSRDDVRRAVGEEPESSLSSPSLYHSAKSFPSVSDSLSDSLEPDTLYVDPEDSDSSEDSTTLSDIDDCFDKEFKNLENIKPDGILDDRILEKLRPRLNNLRHDSIEEVEPWFTKHLKTDSNDEDRSSVATTQQTDPLVADGSEKMVNMFPFQHILRHRRDSASTDFFENAKNTIPANVTTESMNVENKEGANDDHSKLLKIIQKKADDGNEKFIEMEKSFQ